MLAPYIDAWNVWYDAIYRSHKCFYDDDMEPLFPKYPTPKTKIVQKYFKDKKGRILEKTKYYRYEDLLKSLWSIASEQEKLLDIQQSNPQQ